MTKGTLPTRRIRSISLREYAEPSGAVKVDRDACIIRGVKIIGLTSINGRRYLPEAIRSAIALYEGASVRINHPQKADEVRASEDVFGWLQDVRIETDGSLYGDLHYLREHPMAARVCEAAERNPKLFGMSHNASGEGSRDSDGTFVVQRIVEVHSVDIVADPASTAGLFESRRKAPMNLKSLIERATKSAPQNRQSALKKLLEDDMDAMGDMAVDDVPAEGGDWKGDLVAAIGKLVDSDDEADHKMAQKIMAMLKPEAVAPAVEAEDEDPEEKDMEEAEGDEDEKKDDDKEDAKESRQPKRRRKADPAFTQLQEQVAKLLAEKHAAELEKFVRTETEKRKLPCDADLLESLCGMGDRAKITKHLDYLKRVGLTAQRTLPRSQAAGVHIPEGRGPKLDTPENVAAFLLN